MAAGGPVGRREVGGAKNAGLYEGAILARRQEAVRAKLQAFRDEQAKG